MLKNSRKPRGHTQVVRQKTLKNFIIQLLAVLCIALVVSLKSFVWGYSALLGGIIYLVPYAYVANRILTDKGTKDSGNSASQTLAQLYIGQIWKMVIGAMLFALVFVLVEPLSPFSLFGSYIAVQAIGWYLQMRADKQFIKL
jgi:ATP synthase protein I